MNITAIAVKTSMHSELAAIVRYHRKKAGLSQLELARLAGVGKTVVFDIEKEKASVRLDTLLKVLGVLNITLKPESPLMKAYQRDVSHEKS